jgi:hypothetical protein
MLYLGLIRYRPFIHGLKMAEGGAGWAGAAAVMQTLDLSGWLP